MSDQRRRERSNIAHMPSQRTRTTLGLSAAHTAAGAREPPVAIGECVADKYIVERVLGEGGMGIVVGARHRRLDQPVAIKFLSPDVAQRAAAAVRFRREARVVARMHSEHICRMLDIGTLPDGTPFMVMEYLEGCDLAHELEQRGRIPYPEAVSYIVQACDALQEAHDAGIVHRDLKPANLFLERRDRCRRVKVLDFGVSKSFVDGHESQQGLTETASLVGSPLYMSPEQLQSSRDIDPRADVWALGVVLYELISGRAPFTAATVPQLVAAVLHAEPAPWHGPLSPTIPAELEAVVAWTLSKDRSARPASASELATALLPFSERTTSHVQSTTHRPGGASIASWRPGERAAAHTPARYERLASPQRRLRRKAWIGLTLAAAAVVVTALIALGRRSDFHTKPPKANTEVTMKAASAAAPAAPSDGTQPPSTSNPSVARHTGAGVPERPADRPSRTAPSEAPAGMPLTTPQGRAAPEPSEDRHTHDSQTDHDESHDRATAAPRPTRPKAPTRPTAATPRSTGPISPVPPGHVNRFSGAPPRGQISDFGGRR